MGEVIGELLPLAAGVAISDVSDDSPWWTLGVLTITGLAVGVTIQYVPGRPPRTPPAPI